MKRVLVAAAVSMLLPVMAYAGTCASPTPIASFSTVNGNTCGGEIGIDFGGSVMPHPSVVYSFVADGATGAITIDGADREVLLAPSCTQAPMEAGGVGFPLVLDNAIPALVDGQTYLIVVTSDAGIPVGAEPLCGDFTVVTPRLPVSLQNVTVD